jgi:hypothetical protein
MNLIVLVLVLALGLILDLVPVLVLQQVQCMLLPYFLVEELMIKGTTQGLYTVVAMVIRIQVQAHRTMAATANTTSQVHHLLPLLRTITVIAKGQDKGRILIKWVDTMIQITSIMASME